MEVISLGSMCYTMHLVNRYKKLSYPFDSVNGYALQNVVTVLNEMQTDTLNVEKFITLGDASLFNDVNKYSMDWMNNKPNTSGYGMWIAHHVPNKPTAQKDDNVTTFTRRFNRLKEKLNGNDKCVLVYFNRERNVQQRHGHLLNEISDLFKTKHPIVYIDLFKSADNSMHKYNKTYHLDNENTGFNLKYQDIVFKNTDILNYIDELRSNS